MLLSAARFQLLRHRTVRMRLTLLYSSLFLLSGAVLLVVTYLLMSRLFPSTYSVTGGVGRRRPGMVRLPPSAMSLPAQQQATVLHDFMLGSAIALTIMAMAAICLGWLIAGRVLRPLRTMTAAARHISEVNLHERLAVQGPGDELKELADTIDGLLARLESAFDAQRRFVANASHELRTPLTLERVTLETALADPNADAGSFRATCEELLATSRQQEQIIQALLTLARSQRGLEHRESFDLATVTEEVLAARYPEAQRHKLRVETSLGPAMSTGDPQLARRLVANLVDNALAHNVPGGWIDVTTGTREDRAVLWVANSGPAIGDQEVSRLFQPFQRGAGNRRAKPSGATGLGLGLSIVDAIAVAHGATVKGRAQKDGGLDIEISFPAVSAALTSVSPSRHTAKRNRAGRTA
jgi:signal transduction histidine kinase